MWAQSHCRSARDFDFLLSVADSFPSPETKAEIRALARCGDIVGMTGAHEATLASELAVPYAMMCIVDNMANGLADEKVCCSSPS